MRAFLSSVKSFFLEIMVATGEVKLREQGLRGKDFERVTKDG